jgi:hypothetical protein
MSMSESEPHRRARTERARRRHRRGVGAAVAVLAVVALILGVGAWRTHDVSSEPQAAVAPRSTTTSSGGATLPEKLASKLGHKPPRKLSHDDPLRVWVGGDSLAGELGPSLGNELAPTGIVKTAVDFKVGSGLNNNYLRNWPERVPSQMAEYSPDVAIFMIGANDASIVGSDTNAWAPAYRAKVSEMMDLLSGSDHKRTVYWIGPPTMGPTSLDRGAKALGALMADEANHHPHVIYVDAYSMFSGPGGGYSSHLDLPALHATDVLVRIGDGVHFTNTGAEWIAYKVSKLLDEQWQITKQSGGTPLNVTVESGGGSIPGGYQPTYRPPRRRYPTTTSVPSPTALPPSTAGGGASTTVVSHPTSSSTPPTSPPPSSAPPTSAAPPST